ncbi:hypothetical protein DSM3645_08101 [Blastopirellula marina DSM 3645]|uniref:Uncharacterized protein n=1 Tax=Blastopirellula marina DSM 3645 TaxID=314230 RepID=A4A0X5_9BACT|nr:hypothetical protein DSM3645_08101 [Blastopirellula marina DSM 3645]
MHAKRMIGMTGLMRFAYLVETFSHIPLRPGAS